MLSTSGTRLASAGSADPALRHNAFALAKAGKGAAALPLLLAVANTTTDDQECLLHLAACFARMGLGTPAAEVLSCVVASPLREQVARVAATCRGKPVEQAIRLQRAGAAAAALRHVAASEELSEAMQQAADRISTTALYTAAEGLAIEWAVDRGGPRPMFVCRGLTMPAEAVGPVSSSTEHVFMAGSIWQTLAVTAAVPAALPAGWGPGYRRRVIAVAPGRSRIDVLTDLLVSAGAVDSAVEPLHAQQLVILCGTDDTEPLKHWLRDRLHLRLTGPIVGTAISEIGAITSGAGVDLVRSVVQQVLDEQSRLLGELRREIFSPEFAQTRAASDSKRLLIVTTRYSTFMQHSAADLAGAFNAAGHQAEVLLEDDDSSVFASTALLVTQRRVRPDAVVLINFTRSTVADTVPPATPIVTWIQDAMGHLFDVRTGRSVGPRDVVIGHLIPSLFTQFGFPSERTIHTPVLVSTDKFCHSLPAELLEKHRCDVAYVSHQSQTPEMLCSKMIADIGEAAGGRVGAAIRTLYAGVWMAVGECGHRPLAATLPEWVDEVIRRHDLSTDPGVRERLLSTVAWPLADRLLRHRMLGWTSDVCRRRGWTLRLYGKGWDKHHAWSSHACGELAHGQDLAASYAAAKVHLHASLGSSMHQRVMECSLAGGLPVVYRKSDDLLVLDAYINFAVQRDGTPASMTEVWPDAGRRWSFAADHHESMRFVAQCQRLGVPSNAHFPGMFHLRENAGGVARWQPDAPAATAQAAWMLGDLAESTFASEQELENMLEKAIYRADWRADLQAGIANRVRQVFTYDSLVPRITRMLS